MWGILKTLDLDILLFCSKAQRLGKLHILGKWNSLLNCQIDANVWKDTRSMKSSVFEPVFDLSTKFFVLSFQKAAGLKVRNN